MVSRIHPPHVRNKLGRVQTVAIFALYIGCIGFLSLFVLGVM